MTNQDAIRWLDNLKNDIGNPHYERLWPYAQAIDEICAMLEEQEAGGEVGMTDSEYLKPCPFCGSRINTTWNTKYDWQICCENESCFLHEDVIFFKAFDTEEKAIEEWNKRVN